MAPVRWRQIEETFQAALELPPAERPGFLEQACGDDQELRQEVESLLAYDNSESDVVANVVRFAAASFMDPALPEGSRLGPYRVMGEIGKGGMGTIHLAVRADDSYEKRVAIKLVKRGMDTEAVVQRFRHERRILAALEHPYIARLIDGGTSPDGRPYFVMEYIEGQPIDRYCATNNLDLEARCDLFAKVCEAVSYAHRNLVVHRDLKPGNILVTRDGTPKLLDFGIAKLLSNSMDSAPLTKTASMLPFTPDYASPEQVNGDAITTSTDVYSLGAVLFELLTGERAHHFTTYTPVEIERIVCNTDAARPSDVSQFAWKKQLRGDLDNIVMMAMRKEPARRYASVDQFREDLQRRMRDLPVLAQVDSLGYRAKKFLHRNRWGVAAAALTVVGLSVGLVMATISARRAEQQRLVAEDARATAEQARIIAERERVRALRQTRLAEAHRQVAETEHAEAERERDLANAASRRAEERAADLTELANGALFDVHGAITRLPGAFEARRLIVKTTLESLQRLSQHAEGDPRLLRALGSGYFRLGDLQGYPLNPNLGQLEAALTSYNRARTYLRELHNLDPKSLETQLLALQVETHAGRVLDSLDRIPEALKCLLPAREAFDRLHEADPNNTTILEERATLFIFLSHLYARQYEKGLPEALAAVKDMEQVLARQPDNWIAQTKLAGAYASLALVYSYAARFDESIDNYRKAAEIRERIVLTHPNEQEVKRDLVLTLTHLADKISNPLNPAKRDPTAASAYYRRAIVLAEELAARDPSDQTAKGDVASVLLRSGIFTDTPYDREQSVARLLRAEAMTLEQLRDEPNERLSSRNLAAIWQYLGRRRLEQGAYDEALSYFRKTLALTETPVRAVTPVGRQQMMLNMQWLLQALAAKGDRDGVVALAEKARGVAAEAVRQFPGYKTMNRFPPSVEMWLGEAYRTLSKTPAAQASDARTACAAFERSQQEWNELSAREDVKSWRALLDELATRRQECAAVN